MSCPVATGYTQAFVAQSLPHGAKALLEIGCGAGELAERLRSDGFTIVALDVDDACVAAARARGVDARLLSWPSQMETQFDAILFTRSLHHIEDLDGAIEAARCALRPAGRLIIEDFRAEGGSERGRRWYHAMVRELADQGALNGGSDVDALLEKVSGPSEGDHELHSSWAIQDALTRHLQVSETDAAYYFRYMEPSLRTRDAQGLLDLELAKIDKGEIDPLGKRFVAGAR